MEHLPEPVRNEILFQHEVLQVMLEHVVEAAERVLRGEPLVHDLRDAERTLRDTLLEHLRHEERILAPCAEARSVSAQLHALHERSLHALEHRHGADSARVALHLARTLQVELADEDRALLGARRPYDA